MTQKRFESWNWQFDFGEGSIPTDGPLPARYAIAYYDHRGRLYRVVKRVKELADYPDGDPTAFGTYVYDYFCDANGRILQKRSLDEQGSVFLIIDFEYDLERKEVIETAWSLADGTCKSRRQPFLAPREEKRLSSGSRPKNEHGR